MTRTYHKTFRLVIAVEADSQGEAQRITADIAKEVRGGLPVGARLGQCLHAAKLGTGQHL